MSKTLGQIAHHSWQDRLGCDQNRWEQLDEYVQLAWEAAANAIIEECAKVADHWGAGNWKVQPQNGRSRFTQQDLQVQTNTTGRGIAEDIRSLKTSTGEETANE